MVGEVIVRDGDGSRPHNCINKAISTVGERAVIDPDVAGSKDGHGITISHGPPAIVGRRTADHSVSSRLAVMNVEAMDDDVVDKLNSDAGTVGNVDIHTTAINGLETVHDELLLQSDDHVTLEHNPEGLVLDHGMTEGPWVRVHRIIITRVSHNIVSSITTTNCIAAESNAAVCKALAVEVPLWVTSPAVVNGISSSTGQEAKFTASCVVVDCPAKYNIELIQHLACLIVNCQF